MGRESDNENQDEYLLCRDQTQRNIRPAKRFSQEYVIAYAPNTTMTLNSAEPKIYHEAISSKDHGTWKLAKNIS